MSGASSAPAVTTIPGGTANPAADSSASVAALPPSIARSGTLASAKFTIIEVAYITHAYS
jgi:hypothetical protein